MAELLELPFGGLNNSIAENRVPKEAAWAMQNCLVDRGILEGMDRYRNLGTRVGAAAGDIGWGLGYGKYSGNTVMKLTPTGTWGGGYFYLIMGGNSTGAIRYTAVAGGADDGDGTVGDPRYSVQAALEGLAAIDLGDVYCWGGPFPNSPIFVEFRGQYAGTNVAALTVNVAALTGSTPGLDVTVAVEGGPSEEYLVVVQHAGSATAVLYSVEPETGVYTQVATGLHASDWFFAQFGQKIYASNPATGLQFKVIGGDWNNGATSAKPSAPTSPPSIARSSNHPGTIDFSGATFGDYTNWGSNPTVTGYASGGISLTLNAALTDKTVSFTATIASTNLGFRDFVRLHQRWTTGDHELVLEDTDISFIDATPTEVEPKFRGTPQVDPTYGFVQRQFQFADNDRTTRAATVKIKFTLHFVTGGNTKAIYLRPEIRDNWMNDGISLNLDEGPSQDAIHYAYSYYDTSDETESDLSPEKRSEAFPGSVNGEFLVLTAKGSTELTTSDKVYFYRYEKETGLWRRLRNADGSYGVANDNTAGSVTFSDHWMENEIEDFDLFEQPGFPGPSRGILARNLGVWKQCLVVGANRQVWMSGVGQPERFAPSPDDDNYAPVDPEDPGRPRTEYMDDARAENVQSIVGQDSLYLVGDASSYAMVGDSPGEATPPRRLPGSRGTPSRRGAYRLGGGVLVASPDMLAYYSVGRGFSGEDNGALVEREETLPARLSYEQLLGLGGEHLIVIEHNDQIWVFHDEAYLVNTRERRWHAGTFRDSVKAAWATRAHGLVFIDGRGRLMEIVPGVAEDDGNAVSWWYQTGVLDGPRVQIREVIIRGQGNPTVMITVWDGDDVPHVWGPVTKEDDTDHIVGVDLPPGVRYQVELGGVVGTDTVEYFAVGMPEGASSARRN